MPSIMISLSKQMYVLHMCINMFPSFLVGRLRGGLGQASPHCVAGLQGQSRDQLRGVHPQSGRPLRRSQDRDPERHPSESQ